MDEDIVASLRPAEFTIAGIIDAIRKAEDKHSTTVELVAALKTQRDEQFLDEDATLEDYQQTNKAIEQAEWLLGRITNMIPSMHAKLVQLRKEANGAQVRILAESYEAKVAKFRRFMDEDYPGLAAAIAAGMRLEEEARRLSHAIHLWTGRRAKDLPDGFEVPHPPISIQFGWIKGVTEFGALVKLPGNDGGHNHPNLAHWWPNPSGGRL